MSLTGATQTDQSKAVGVDYNTPLAVGTSVAAPSVNEARAVPYVPLHMFDSHDGKMLVIQTGNFTCAANKHRAFILTTDGLVLPACAEIKDEVIDVQLETGVTIHVAFKSTLS